MWFEVETKHTNRWFVDHLLLISCTLRSSIRENYRVYLLITCYFKNIEHDNLDEEFYLKKKINPRKDEYDLKTD